MDNKGQNLPKFMMGAIVGDIAGLLYERRNINHLIKESEMIKEDSCFTDDTVMTCAVSTGFVKMSFKKNCVTFNKRECS